MANHERWIEHTRSLPPLSVGDHVRIQNQVDNCPLRWDKTGVIIEVRQFYQYVVRVDGSGRITVNFYVDTYLCTTYVGLSLLYYALKVSDYSFWQFFFLTYYSQNYAHNCYDSLNYAHNLLTI